MYPICQFHKDDEEYKQLLKLAEILTKKSPNKYKYVVEDTYFDLGQDWKWTTIIGNSGGNWGGYQALNPREQEDLFLSCETDEHYEALADAILSDKFCPDRRR